MKETKKDLGWVMVKGLVSDKPEYYMTQSLIRNMKILHLREMGYCNFGCGYRLRRILSKSPNLTNPHLLEMVLMQGLEKLMDLEKARVMQKVTVKDWVLDWAVRDLAQEEFQAGFGFEHRRLEVAVVPFEINYL